MPRAAEPVELPAEAERDADLVRLIVEGDPAALTNWFRRFRDGVYRFAYYRLATDADLAADATQQTFLVALERLADFDPERGSMSHWLQLLSRNVIRDLLARHKRGAQLETLWNGIDDRLRETLGGIDSELLPDEALERDETRELVAMTLANLPESHRQVLTDKYMRGRSIEQIAVDRDTTSDGVKSMLRRARQSFRDCFLMIAQFEVHDV